MEKFIVSARKYRPQNFSTVVGQAHITTTLKNAIKNNQLAHAFLFCGPRGVGKTTCARILAKTINCENRQPDGEACNHCQSCVSFNDGASLNIHELDAASNNSVDDIRSLVEQVRFAPQAGKYKVYIIDEVHMLTSSAFNAFLKTLEEPPPYAIFILATTEKHKILPTILSRCQIFDFKRITTNDTVLHLEEICEKESITAERPALQVIAQKSEGCMRDALSILDKIVSFTNGELTYQNTLEHLNILDADYYFKLTDCMLQQDLSGAMLLYDDINKKGFEGDLVLNGFAEFLRNILICKDDKVADLLEVVESFKDKYKSTASGVSLGYIISALNLLNEAEINYRAARNKRLHVELALIKLCYLQQAIELSSSDNGITKKKLVDTAKPVAFRQFAMTPVTPASSSKKTGDGNVKLAKLLIEEEAEKKLIMTGSGTFSKDPVLIPTGTHEAEVKQATATMIKPPPGQKLGALNKIREQYTSPTLASPETAVKVLDNDSLKACWAAYVEKLKAARNPAVQSFELAVLNVNHESGFEIVSGNNLEQKFIEQQRLPLTEHVQLWFNNRQLTYSLLVEEQPGRLDKADIPLSSKEQYQKLIAEYPLVKELKDRLRLELDY